MAHINLNQTHRVEPGDAKPRGDLSALLLGGHLPPELAALLAPQRTFISDDDIQTHDSNAIVVPRDRPLEWARDALDAKIREQDEEHTFTRVFPYRPEDGANAVANVLHTMFGIVVGKSTPQPFGMPPKPPQYRTIDVAFGKKREVPWGEITIPALPGASVRIGGAHGETGPVLYVEVTSPKKHKKTIEEFFAAVERELKVHSIYRGHAVEGAHELRFLDLTGFDPRTIVYSDEVQTTLDAALFSVIRYPAAVRKAGMKLRRAVLVYGPYGGGKSSLGLVAAKECTEHGWTFVSAKAGRDNLRDVLLTAALYQNAVVLIEDIDAHTPGVSAKDTLSELLDLFDGIGVKNTNVILIATTNHVEDVPAGMLRPRRFDYVVEISGLDRGATEKLLRVSIPTDALGQVDFDAVHAEMPGFQPAWVVAVADRAQSFAIARTQGRAAFRLTTEDLVKAARSLHPQLELMRLATEGRAEPDLVAAMRQVVTDGGRQSVEGARVVDCDGDSVGGWQLTTRDD